MCSLASQSLQLDEAHASEINHHVHQKWQVQYINYSILYDLHTCTCFKFKMNLILRIINKPILKLTYSFHQLEAGWPEYGIEGYNHSNC